MSTREVASPRTPATRRRRLRYAALAVAALALVVTVVMVVRSGPREEVPMPPAGAGPEQVVGSYLHALDAHDVDTARALVAPRSRPGFDHWIDSVDRVRNRHLGQARVEPGGRVAVDTRFDLSWRLFRDDHTVPEGPIVWGFLLERSSGSGPWRIVDQGNV